jgi:hypothetical protein
MGLKSGLICSYFFSVFSAFGLCAWRIVPLGMILTTFPLELSVYVCVGFIEQSMQEMIMIGIF